MKLTTAYLILAALLLYWVWFISNHSGPPEPEPYSEGWKEARK